jgi:hypothetical protein
MNVDVDDMFDDEEDIAEFNRKVPVARSVTEMTTLTRSTMNDNMTDEQILQVAEPFGEFTYGDAQGHKRIAFARALLAAAVQKEA